MEYDFSALPGNHRKRDSWLAIGAVIALAVLTVSSVIPVALVEAVLQVLAVASIVALGGYVLVAIYLDNRGFRQFVAQNDLIEVSEADMLAAIPPCFAELRNNPDLVDLFVKDGYMLKLPTGVDCMLFNLDYVLQDGRERRSYEFAIAVMLEQRVFPHLFLDGKQNGVSYAYEGSQHLGLEGDFDDYFNLYVPDGEATDALTLFTPDVMQTLVDGGRPYDIEIVEDTVSVIAKGNQYTQAKLPALLRFMAAFDRQLSEKPADWSEVDVAAALDSELQPRKVYDPLYLVWAMAAVAIIVTAWSFLQ